MRSIALALLAVLGVIPALPVPAAADCADITKVLARVATDLTCVESTDLTTRNDATTPQDNSRLGLPPNAFTPRTDAQAVSPDAPFRTAIDPSRTFPGLQVTGAMADDPNARWLLRLPASANWNGRLVVGVPGGFRSEFMGDYIFSDLVVQQGFAYVSTNKGMLNFFFTATGAAFTHFFYEVQNGNHIERYRQSCCNFVQLEFIQPHAHRALQLLVDWVERGVLPPASQCIPRGGTIVGDLAGAGRPERCPSLLVE